VYSISESVELIYLRKSKQIAAGIVVKVEGGSGTEVSHNLFKPLGFFSPS